MAERDGPVIGVTGSSGYLGSNVVAHLRAADFKVVEFRRGVDEMYPGVARYFDLAHPPDADTFRGITCLVHAEWDLHETDPLRAWERNVEGSRQVLAEAVAAGIERVIFVSSMSAYFGTRQDYGLMRLAVERIVLEMNQVVVRPGLVYGGIPGEMAQTLSKLASLPVIPIFRGAHLFTLHIDDFVAAVAALVEAESVPSSVIGLAYETPTPFREIMLAMVSSVGNSKRTLTIPWRPVLGLLRVLERLNVPLPVRSDSLLGLVRPAAVVPGRDVAESLGLSFRNFTL
ncbi:MAG: NAD(P)-dependent oxidoreductase [Acidimicrobiales bacterium]